MPSAHEARLAAKLNRSRQVSAVERLRLRGYSVCRMHGAGGGTATGKRNGNLSAWQTLKEAVQAVN